MTAGPVNYPDCFLLFALIIRTIYANNALSAIKKKPVWAQKKLNRCLTYR